MAVNLIAHARDCLKSDFVLRAWHEWLADVGKPDSTRPLPQTWRNFAASSYGRECIDLHNIILVPVETAQTVIPASKPIDTVQSQPMPQPTPCANNNGAAVQENLFSLIAQGLKQTGFQPDTPPIDEAAVRRIAQELVLEAMDAGAFQRTIQIQIDDTVTAEIEGEPPKWFGRALKLASADVPCLLIGPAGSGKSFGARLIAEALGRRFFPISLSGGVDEGILSGWLLPVGEGGRFEYVPSTFVDAYENGGVVLLDEMDAADPNMLLIINEALANGHFPLPLRRENPIAERHADFVCIAAANTYGHGADRQYVGRNQLDEATLSRFRLGQINVDFDADLERKLYAHEVVLYGHRLRDRCRAIAGWVRDVSTRDIAQAHRLTAVFESVEHAWFGFFTDWSDDELGRIDVMLDTTNETAILR